LRSHFRNSDASKMGPVGPKRGVHFGSPFLEFVIISFSEHQHGGFVLVPRFAC
jgi:hypothetical protein